MVKNARKISDLLRLTVQSTVKYKVRVSAKAMLSLWGWWRQREPQREAVTLKRTEQRERVARKTLCGNQNAIINILPPLMTMMKMELEIIVLGGRPVQCSTFPWKPCRQRFVVIVFYVLGFRLVGRSGLLRSNNASVMRFTSSRERCWRGPDMCCSLTVHYHRVQ